MVGGGVDVSSESLQQVGVVVCTHPSMKLIFLDIDGVLVTRRPGVFEDPCADKNILRTNTVQDTTKVFEEIEEKNHW
eukprot:374472-Amphidinium_carterae.1